MADSSRSGSARLSADPRRPRVGLWDLLACPACHRRVRPRGDGLGCVQCGRTYPIVHGVPVLLPEDTDAFPLDTTLPGRNGYDPWIPRATMGSLPADAIILEIGAGNMQASRPNLIRMDVTLTPHVDVV